MGQDIAAVQVQAGEMVKTRSAVWSSIFRGCALYKVKVVC